jgi:cobalamin biosynthesis Mg chelatase CobN
MKTKSIRALLSICTITILLLVSAILFSGCRTTKQATKTSAEIALKADLTSNQTNEAALDIESKLSKTEATNAKVQSTDNSIVDETIEENSTKTTFSPPDSTGKQYPTSQTNTNKKTHRGKQNALKTAAETKAKAETTAQKNDKSDYKSEASVKDKGKSTDKTKVDDKKETETQTPGFVSWSMILLVLALLGLTYLVLKRFKAVK